MNDYTLISPEYVYAFAVGNSLNVFRDLHLADSVLYSFRLQSVSRAGYLSSLSDNVELAGE